VAERGLSFLATRGGSHKDNFDESLRICQLAGTNVGLSQILGFLVP
jgi:hypothetical protein